MPVWSLFYEVLVNMAYALAFRFLGLRALVALLALGVVLVVTAVLLYGSLNICALTGPGVYAGGIVRVTFSFFAGAEELSNSQIPTDKPRTAAVAPMLASALNHAALTEYPKTSLAAWRTSFALMR